MTDGAKEADEQLVKPLFQFRNYGQQLPHHWSTVSNEAAFGTDYFTRTAVAKSNILVNSPNETKYFYQDLDANGGRLNSANRYTVTFAKGRPRRSTVSGRCRSTTSIISSSRMPINRFSVGTKNKDLKFAADGSLTIYVQADAPTDRAARQLAARAQGRLLALRPRLLAEGGGQRRILDAASRTARGGHHDGGTAVT